MDRGATGGNDRPTASSSVDGAPVTKASSDAGDTSEKSDGSGSTSPETTAKTSSTDGTNQADIKLLARQVLMDARKKAGASGALPRERVAEIAKASKGPTVDKATAEADKSDGGAQEKEKVTRWPVVGCLFGDRMVSVFFPSVVSVTYRAVLCCAICFMGSQTNSYMSLY